jgi:hypothetical protein
MMNAIFSVTQTLHITVGAFALVLFWLPALLKKGSANHSRFGRYYVYAMYAVAVTGCTMASLGLIDPSAFIANPSQEPALLAGQVAARSSSWIFLLYLSLLTFTSVRHGVLVLRHKAQRQQLKSPMHLLLMLTLTVAGPMLAMRGYGQGQILPIIFGMLGMAVGGGFLHYSFKASLSKMEWWIEHLGAMIGSGIACYTAFFAFGGSRLFTHYGSLQLMSWILPGIIGTFFIRYLSKQYQRKFSGQKA